jgi:hypothetical protein
MRYDLHVQREARLERFSIGRGRTSGVLRGLVRSERPAGCSTLARVALVSASLFRQTGGQGQQRWLDELVSRPSPVSGFDVLVDAKDLVGSGLVIV